LLGYVCDIAAGAESMAASANQNVMRVIEISL
jgi:hypothetical protein